MRKRLPLALVGFAALLLALAFVLARCGEERMGRGQAPTAPAVKPVEFPRDRQRRQVQATPRPPGTPAPSSSSPRGATDRLTRVFRSPGKDGAVVVEINAIRHAPLVERFLACEQARRGDGSSMLNELRDTLGIDVTEDVDRVGFDKDVLAVSGFFEKLQLPPEFGAGEAVGTAGRIFQAKDAEGRGMFVGRVGDDLLLTGFDEAQVRAAIDRAEGRAEPGSTFPESIAGGEVYGVIGASLLQDLLGDSADPTAQKLATMLTETRVQMAVDDAAALSLDLSTKNPEEASDLARALGGLVAAGRAQALDAGDTELAGLLEQARVDTTGGRVAFDFAIPGDDLLRLLGCDAEGRPLGTPGVPSSKPTQ